MKVEVGKFYRTRNGKKERVEKIFGGVAHLSNGDMVFSKTGRAYDNPEREYKHDLIEEWKEPEVKEQKFNVGDRVRDLGWNGKTVGTITKIGKDGEYTVDYSPHAVGICSGYENRYGSQLELVKPKIAVGSRWTNIGKESKTVTVVHINDKYVTFEHDGRGTIETTTYDMFYMAYKPYVEPPKSLVGYVGVYKNRETDKISFSGIYDSEKAIGEGYKYINDLYDLIATKKIEWTEGE